MDYDMQGGALNPISLQKYWRETSELVAAVNSCIDKKSTANNPVRLIFDSNF